MFNDRSNSEDSEDKEDRELTDDEFVDLQNDIAWPEISDGGSSSGTISAATTDLNRYYLDSENVNHSASQLRREGEIGEPHDSDLDEKDEAPVGDSADRNCFGVSIPEVTKEELPYLGFAVAALVFFFSAVGKKMKSVDNLFDDEISSSTVDGVIFTDIPGIDGTAFEDVVADSTGSYTDAYTDINSGDICGYYNAFIGKLSLGPYAFALCHGIFGCLMGGGVIGWMRYNESLKAKRNTAVGEYPERPAASDEIDEFEPEDDENNIYKSTSELFLENHLWLINLFLYAWAFVGWLFFTFWGDRVYVHTGNGFFALWAMMLFSIWNFGFTFEDLTKNAKDTDSCIYGLMLASIIVTIALSSGWKYGTYRGIAGFALSVCVFSMLFGLATVYFAKFSRGGARLDPKIKFWCIAVLLVLWILAACLTTFVGPFLTTGNGYFSVWASVVFSGLAFVEAQKESCKLNRTVLVPRSSIIAGSAHT